MPVAYQFASFVGQTPVLGWTNNLSGISILLDDSHSGTYIVDATATYTVDGVQHSSSASVSGGRATAMNPIPVNATGLQLDLAFKGMFDDEKHRFNWPSPVGQFPNGQIIIDLYGCGRAPRARSSAAPARSADARTGPHLSPICTCPTARPNRPKERTMPWDPNTCVNGFPVPFTNADATNLVHAANFAAPCSSPRRPGRDPVRVHVRAVRRHDALRRGPHPLRLRRRRRRGQLVHPRVDELGHADPAAQVAAIAALPRKREASGVNRYPTEVPDGGAHPGLRVRSAVGRQGDLVAERRASLRDRCTALAFEVAEHRMATEFSAPVSLDRLGYTMALHHEGGLPQDMNECTVTHMSRTTLSTAELRKPLVASAAVRAFARGGFHATTIADVAREAKISPAYVISSSPRRSDCSSQPSTRASTRCSSPSKAAPQARRTRRRTASSTRWVRHMPSSSWTARSCSCRCTPSRSPRSPRSGRRSAQASNAS
ncbi:TetR family transcriptional regulator [Oerskovia sp. M15]